MEILRLVDRPCYWFHDAHKEGGLLDEYPFTNGYIYDGFDYFVILNLENKYDFWITNRIGENIDICEFLYSKTGDFTVEDLSKDLCNYVYKSNKVLDRETLNAINEHFKNNIVVSFIEKTNLNAVMINNQYVLEMIDVNWGMRLFFYDKDKAFDRLIIDEYIFDDDADFVDLALFKELWDKPSMLELKEESRMMFEKFLNLLITQYTKFDFEEETN